MIFNSRADLEAYISQRIGDIDQDVDRDAVVRLLAAWVVVQSAGWYELSYGDDWSEPYEDVFPQDDWPETVSSAVEIARKTASHAR